MAPYVTLSLTGGTPTSVWRSLSAIHGSATHRHPCGGRSQPSMAPRHTNIHVGVIPKSSERYWESSFFLHLLHWIPDVSGMTISWYTNIRVAAVPSHPCDRDTPSSLTASFQNSHSDIRNPAFFFTF